MAKNRCYCNNDNIRFVGRIMFCLRQLIRYLEFLLFIYLIVLLVDVSGAEGQYFS
jgi:hypothetical protein